MHGFELVTSNLGGWSLDKHHALNIRSGILHKGNGENIFLSQQPPVISTVMGNGFYRSVPCGPSCSGAAREMMLFAPVALASGPDGSLYIGDFNFIRRVHPDGYTRTILELKNRDTRHSTSPAHKYYLAMDPVGEVLYVSDTSSRRVYRVRNLGQPKDPARNLEVVAGTGEQCLPFDQSHCGEGRKATEAALNNPRDWNTAPAPARPRSFIVRDPQFPMIQCGLKWIGQARATMADDGDKIVNKNVNNTLSVTPN
ncbi:Teneurin-1 [Ameca splendens]|uniref:Teneurin-1 n=1 Tax=Ameca splendens TaxID=208324 RepID=A0ABV0ZMX3_9TELE